MQMMFNCDNSTACNLLIGQLSAGICKAIGGGEVAVVEGMLRFLGLEETIKQTSSVRTVTFTSQRHNPVAARFPHSA